MKIYILRHGQTEWNKENRVAYNKELLLNETGLKQAEYARKQLENIDYDLVISSPFIRAKTTAEIANNGRKEIIIDERLSERNIGIIDGEPLEKVNLTDIFNYYKNIEIEGAENMQDFCKRVWSFLDELKEKYPDKTILLATHNIVIRAIKAYVLGIPEDGNLRQYGVDNCKIEEYIL